MRKPPLTSRHSGMAAPLASYVRYSSDAAVAQYCDAHYGPDKFGITNFPARLVQLSLEQFTDKPTGRALDLGCAVGRASFELAAHFDQVTAIDLSTRFIEIANRLQQRGAISYRLPEEGDLLTDQKIILADLGLESTKHKVEFRKQDAQNLATEFRGYDLILAANLIDRLPDPGGFLSGIHQRLEKGGLLVLASPYLWLEQYTPRRRWLGGRFRAGVPQSGLTGMQKKLAARFELISEPQEIEYVIRETSRSFQHGISQLTFWCRVR